MVSGDPASNWRHSPRGCGRYRSGSSSPAAAEQAELPPPPAAKPPPPATELPPRTSQLSTPAAVPSVCRLTERPTAVVTQQRSPPVADWLPELYRFSSPRPKRPCRTVPRMATPPRATPQTLPLILPQSLPAVPATTPDAIADKGVEGGDEAGASEPMEQGGGAQLEPLEQGRAVGPSTAADDDILCCECGSGEEAADDLILLCDGVLPTGECDYACHQTCLPRPLARIPTGEWLCPSCAAAETQGNRRGSSLAPSSVGGRVKPLSARHRVGPCFQVSQLPEAAPPPAPDAADAAAEEDARRGGVCVWSPRPELAAWGAVESDAMLDGLSSLSATLAVPRELLGGQPSAAPLPLPTEDDEPICWGRDGWPHPAARC